MQTNRFTVQLVALAILTSNVAANAGITITPPDANFVSVPSKSIGDLTSQEPVMFTSFGMFGTLAQTQDLTQQVLITTEDTATMTGAADSTSIALFNSIGDLLAIGAPSLDGAHSVIDFALTSGQYYVAATTPDAIFGDGFAVTLANVLVPSPLGSYSLRIMTTPTPGALAVLGLGLCAVLRRRSRSEIAE